MIFNIQIFYCVIPPLFHCYVSHKARIFFYLQLLRLVGFCPWFFLVITVKCLWVSFVGIPSLGLSMLLPPFDLFSSIYNQNRCPWVILEFHPKKMYMYSILWPINYSIIFLMLSLTLKWCQMINNQLEDLVCLMEVTLFGRAKRKNVIGLLLERVQR